MLKDPSAKPDHEEPQGSGSVKSKETKVPEVAPIVKVPMVDTARTEQPKAETEHTSLGAQTIPVSKEPHSETSPNVPVEPPQRTDDKQRFKADNYSGVLVKDEIRDKKLIQVPDPEREETQCYQPASYDLRLGAQYAVPNDKGDLEISNCEITGRLTIPAFGTAIVSTYETVALPDNVVARFNLRVQHALEGLIVQMGTQVEPHYEGPLFALLHNVSDSPKTLKFRDFDTRPFTIEFSYTSRPASSPDSRKKRRKSFSDFIPTNCARGGLNLALARMHQLQSETKKLSQDLNARKILWFTGGFLLIIVLAATVLIPIALTKFSYDRDYFPLVSADAIAAMKYGPNHSNDTEIVRKVLHELDIQKSTELVSREEFLSERLVQLKARREVIKSNPAFVAELHSIDRQINEIVDLLKK